ncbi:MAG TPA: metallophosphoesterase family protein, partial [Bryobacteraceae bacterium]|nr:metallophosphoesterase family protein [Bryobacteraceae bacterium]
IAMRIGLLSDTHGDLDPAVFDYFAECDELWHAGDVGSVDILDALNAFRPTRAVWGNIDGQDVRRRLAEVLEWECEGMLFRMIHIAPKRRAGGGPMLVCGHSHILRIAPGYLNPGACGHHGWHKERTVLRFSVDGGKLGGMEVVHLGPRGRRQS